ncbi:unnamed protein product [Amoebophrya sp. A25]|nr:unnamed protein product [Amoebophrya sp. A25]|eukprot:GSA25T00003549001.1
MQKVSQPGSMKVSQPGSTRNLDSMKLAAEVEASLCKFCWDEDTKPQELSDSYECTELLGAGAFAVVLKVVDKETSTAYALKVLQNEEYPKRGMLQLLEDEVKAMEYFGSEGDAHHENIIDATHIWANLDDAHTFILMPLVETTLMHIQKGCRTHRIGEGYAKNWISQVVRGVVHLHHHSWAHRDLKPDNLLYEPNTNCVKICDFGWATEILNKETGDVGANGMCGTPLFNAPEVGDLERFPRLTSKVDVWAIGVVFFTLLQNDVYRIGDVRHEQALSFLPGISEGAKSLIKLCVLREPHKRPTAVQLLLRPYLSATGMQAAAATAGAAKSATSSASLRTAELVNLRGTIGAFASRARLPQSTGGGQQSTTRPAAHDIKAGDVSSSMDSTSNSRTNYSAGSGNADPNSSLNTTWHGGLSLGFVGQQVSARGSLHRASLVAAPKPAGRNSRPRNSFGGLQFIPNGRPSGPSANPNPASKLNDFGAKGSNPLACRQSLQGSMQRGGPLLHSTARNDITSKKMSPEEEERLTATAPMRNRTLSSGGIRTILTTRPATSGNRSPVFQTSSTSTRMINATNGGIGNGGSRVATTASINGGSVCSSSSTSIKPSYSTGSSNRADVGEQRLGGFAQRSTSVDLEECGVGLGGLSGLQTLQSGQHVSLLDQDHRTRHDDQEGRLASQQNRGEGEGEPSVDVVDNTHPPQHQQHLSSSRSVPAFAPIRASLPSLRIAGPLSSGGSGTFSSGGSSSSTSSSTSSTSVSSSSFSTKARSPIGDGSASFSSKVLVKKSAPKKQRTTSTAATTAASSFSGGWGRTFGGSGRTRLGDISEENSEEDIPSIAEKSRCAKAGTPTRRIDENTRSRILNTGGTTSPKSLSTRDDESRSLNLKTDMHNIDRPHPPPSSTTPSSTTPTASPTTSTSLSSGGGMIMRSSPKTTEGACSPPKTSPSKPNPFLFKATGDLELVAFNKSSSAGTSTAVVQSTSINDAKTTSSSRKTSPLDNLHTAAAAPVGSSYVASSIPRASPSRGATPVDKAEGGSSSSSSTTSSGDLDKAEGASASSSSTTSSGSHTNISKMEQIEIDLTQEASIKISKTSTPNDDDEVLMLEVDKDDLVHVHVDHVHDVKNLEDLEMDDIPSALEEGFSPVVRALDRRTVEQQKKELSPQQHPRGRVSVSAFEQEQGAFGGELQGQEVEVNKQNYTTDENTNTSEDTRPQDLMEDVVVVDEDFVLHQVDEVQGDDQDQVQGAVEIQEVDEDLDAVEIQKVLPARPRLPSFSSSARRSPQESRFVAPFPIVDLKLNMIHDDGSQSNRIRNSNISNNFERTSQDMITNINASSHSTNISPRRPSPSPLFHHQPASASHQLHLQHKAAAPSGRAERNGSLLQRLNRRTANGLATSMDFGNFGIGSRPPPRVVQNLPASLQMKSVVSPPGEASQQVGKSAGSPGVPPGTPGLLCSPTNCIMPMPQSSLVGDRNRNRAHHQLKMMNFGTSSQGGASTSTASASSTSSSSPTGPPLLASSASASGYASASSPLAMNQSSGTGMPSVKMGVRIFEQMRKSSPTTSTSASAVGTPLAPGAAGGSGGNSLQLRRPPSAAAAIGGMGVVQSTSAQQAASNTNDQIGENNQHVVRHPTKQPSPLSSGRIASSSSSPSPSAASYIMNNFNTGGPTGATSSSRTLSSSTQISASNDMTNRPRTMMNNNRQRGGGGLILGKLNMLQINQPVNQNHVNNSTTIASGAGQQNAQPQQTLLSNVGTQKFGTRPVVNFPRRTVAQNLRRQSTPGLFRHEQ